MNDSDKLQAICADRDAHRAEIVAAKSDLMQVLFAFLVFAAAAAGVYWSDTIVKDPAARSWLLFVAAQVEFVLALFWLQLTMDMGIHSGYIAALEKKINELAGETVTGWESGIMRTYYATPRSAPFWNGIVLMVMSVALFLALMAMAAAGTRNFLLMAVLLVELSISAFRGIAALREPSRASRIAEGLISLSKKRTPNQASEATSEAAPGAASEAPQG